MISLVHSSEPSRRIHAESLSDGTRAPRPLADPVSQDRDDEYRHRMLVNLLAAMVLVALMGAGLWLVNTMVESQKAQGCYTSGERTCSLI